LSVRINWYGSQVDAAVKASALKGLLEGAEYLLEEADRDVPHDTGALQDTGETSLSPEEMKATVSYDTPYAMRLHEHPGYHFQNGRKGKWLEDAFKNYGAKAFQHVAAAIKRATGG
jgi:hypothetical protein